MLTVILASLGPYSSPLLAQTTSTLPGAQACGAAVSAVDGGAPPTDAVWWTAARCGSQGGQALAGALRRLRSTSESETLGSAEAVLRSIRDSSVFAASLEVAAASDAAQSARMLGLRVLLAQHAPEALIGHAPSCRRLTIAGPSFTRGASLPPDYVSRAIAVLRNVTSSSGATTELRQLGVCVLEVFTSAAPSTSVTTGLHLTYLCGTRFRVRNSTDEWVDLTYDVYRTDDRGDLTVPPRSESVIVTDAVGTTRLFVNPDHAMPLGRLIQTKANGGRPCP